MGSPDPPALLRLARDAAIAGGRIVAERPGAPEHVKGAGDYVTDADRASERAIREILARGTPDVPVHGEEGGGRTGDRYWLVDPLDGTTNFIHGFWAVGVSVALIEDGRPAVGVVHAPLLGRTWSAARGLGATCDDRPLRVSDRGIARAVVGTGFPFRRRQLLPRYLHAFQAGLRRFEDLRRPGAASLDLAWVAEGVFEGFFELGLSPWDVAAGALLIEEAGGVVTDWDGGPGYLAGDVLAGAPEVHAALLEIARGWARRPRTRP